MRSLYLAHMHKSPLHAHYDVSSGLEVYFWSEFYLHPYFVYASSQESSEFVDVCRLPISIMRQVKQSQYVNFNTLC